MDEDKHRLEGSLVIDKPEGMTSHDVVNRVRGVLDLRRVGHAGTLDRFATGVLVVCVGRATRLMQFLVGLDKEYVATVRLGFATDTQDRTGSPISLLADASGIDGPALRRTLAGFTGEQMQLPPMYSAKKVRGERLHRAARAGRQVERSPVKITIHSLELLQDDGVLTDNDDGTRDFRIRVKCSSGTYVRTLGHDIGERLGVGAHLAALRRVAVGQFSIEQAITLEQLMDLGWEGRLTDGLISPTETLSHLPRRTLSEDDVRRVSLGQTVSCPAIEAVGAGIRGGAVVLCDSVGSLVAVAVYDPDVELLRPHVVVASP